MHDGFDVVCEQPDFDLPNVDPSYWNYWDQQITLAARLTERDEWKRDLERDLAPYFFEPLTEQNLVEIYSLVNGYFSDSMFHQIDHRVNLIVGPDGIEISVVMKYEDADDFYEDFDTDEDHISLIQLTGVPILAVGDNDGLFQDAVWAIARQEAAGKGPEVQRAVAEARELAKTDSEKPDQKSDILRKSADEILFEPIVKKEPEKAPVTPDYDDSGIYCYE